MNSMSGQAKQELFSALNGRESGVFVLNGKLVSVEVEGESERIDHALDSDLAQEIEEYPELKASLTRYIDNPDMRRYVGRELKSKRNEKRK
ncbi:hypothetical protein JCM9140_2765 [Halalkalibacter wakoensis JCM 9140]|uniref:Uncharacterized protein n=1 Tax=Halalkalibacter wakoensis JCM 9140 TaxID=1236970 RepID=W4Q5N6_9BACI|nr:hypothetical protein [Halalkalibacter wakoensis]GAE26679.1 hypothetical protein JCM9140_2765 [Halalkalibacter wakoensis JCM 9140]